MAMVDEAAKKRTGVFLQQHRRWCPHENNIRHRLGSSASLTLIVENGWRKRALADASAEEGMVGAPVPMDVVEEVDMSADAI